MTKWDKLPSEEKEHQRGLARARQSLRRLSDPVGVRESNRINNRSHRRRLRNRVIILLGGICAGCGCDNHAFLQVDHRKNNGASERKILTGQMVYRRVLSTPSDYQLLCANCNWLKRDNKAARTPVVEAARTEAIKAFGGCCSECGETNAETLHFDHINNDGNVCRSHRRMLQRYREYISGFHVIALLCANCHQAKTLAKLYQHGP